MSFHRPSPSLRSFESSVKRTFEVSGSESGLCAIMASTYFVIMPLRHGRSQSAALARFEVADNRNTLKQIRFIPVLMVPASALFITRNKSIGGFDNETDDEHVPFWAGADAKIPFVAGSDLRSDGLNHDGNLRTDAVDTVAGSAKDLWKVGASIGTNLAQDVSGNARLDRSIEPADANAALDLERITANEVDAALAQVEVIAGERSSQNGSCIIAKDGSAHREFVCDVPAAESFSSCQGKVAGRQVDCIASDHVDLTVSPSKPRRLNEDVRQSETIEAGLGPVMQIEREARQRSSRCGGEEQSVVGESFGIRDAGAVRDGLKFQRSNRNDVPKPIAQLIS